MCGYYNRTTALEDGRYGAIDIEWYVTPTVNIYVQYSHVIVIK